MKLSCPGKPGSDTSFAVANVCFMHVEPGSNRLHGASLQDRRTYAASDFWRYAATNAFVVGRGIDAAAGVVHDGDADRSAHGADAVAVRVFRVPRADAASVYPQQKKIATISVQAQVLQKLGGRAEKSGWVSRTRVRTAAKIQRLAARVHHDFDAAGIEPGFPRRNRHGQGCQVGLGIVGQQSGKRSSVAGSISGSSPCRLTTIPRRARPRLRRRDRCRWDDHARYDRLSAEPVHGPEIRASSVATITMPGGKPDSLVHKTCSIRYLPVSFRSGLPGKRLEA